MTAKIPTSCTQTETTVLKLPCKKFGASSWDKVAPGHVAAAAFESGQERLVGSVVKLNYKDGSVWRIRVTEFSERNFTTAYELLRAEPAHQACKESSSLLRLRPTTTPSLAGPQNFRMTLIWLSFVT